MEQNQSAVVENKKKPVAPKKRRRRRWVVLTSIVLVAAAVVSIVLMTANARPQANVVALSDTSVLTYENLINTISATGTVESANKTYVYAPLTGTVKSVPVSVGDEVAQGDLLCLLDSASIEKQITEKELSMANTQKSTSQSVKTAKNNYENYAQGIENNTNSSLISANNSVATAYDNLVKAEKTYNDYKEALDKGDNTTINNQANSVTSALVSTSTAKQEYDDAVLARDNAYSAMVSYQVYVPTEAEIQAAKDAAEAAKLVMEAAQAEKESTQAQYKAALDAYTADPTGDGKLDTMRACESLYKAAESAHSAAQTDYNTKREKLTSLQTAATSKTDSKYESLKADYQTKASAVIVKENALINAENSLDTAQNTYDSAVTSADTTLEEYERNLETAKRNYQNALDTQKSTEITVEQQLESYKNSLDTARISAGDDLAQYQLEQLYVELDKTIVAAPMAGTVTAVYATEGATASGLLFVIEDTENLIVTTTVKGYDVGTVDTGMAVAIRSDATGDAVYDGEISFIAPTSNKNSQGKTDTTGDVLFSTEVEVKSSDTGLRIGMSVRLQYIVEQQYDVLAVPYGAVYTNEDGDTCVLVARETTEDKYLIAEAVVSVGMESDLSIEIKEGLSEGDRVIGYPESYSAQIGQEVVLVNEAVRANSSQSGLLFMGRS